MRFRPKGRLTGEQTEINYINFNFILEIADPDVAASDSNKQVTVTAYVVDSVTRTLDIIGLKEGYPGPERTSAVREYSDRGSRTDKVPYIKLVDDGFEVFNNLLAPK